MKPGGVATEGGGAGSGARGGAGQGAELGERPPRPPPPPPPPVRVLLQRAWPLGRSLSRCSSRRGLRRPRPTRTPRAPPVGRRRRGRGPRRHGRARPPPPPPSAPGAGMELFQAKDHYILQQGERALWCSRRDGGLQLRPGEPGGAGWPWARPGAAGLGGAGGEEGARPPLGGGSRAGAACGPGARGGAGRARAEALELSLFPDGRELLSRFCASAGDKGPATLVRPSAPPRRDPLCYPGERTGAEPESSDEGRLALEASSTLERLWHVL